MNNDRFRGRIKQRVTKAKGKLETVVLRFVLEADKRIVMKSPVDTGRFKGNWNISTGVINFSVSDKTSKTRFGASDNYNAGIIKQIKVNGQVIYLTNSLPYSRRLEYDAWSSQAPAGMVRTTIAEMSGIIKAIAAEVRVL